MDLKKLVVDTKSTWIEFAGLEGFEVEVANLSRKELNGLRKRCTSSKFSRKTRMVEETLDEEKFVVEFSRATVLNWKGLTLDHLQTLLLVETGDEDLTKEVEFSVDNAEVLVSQSSEFDTWLNEVVFDLENFRNQPKKSMPGKAGGAVQAK
tara:strand:+ start:2155 stop:2607 length:453 start_codon:yes stop_codon:yes gene_type:complete